MKTGKTNTANTSIIILLLVIVGFSYLYISYKREGFNGNRRGDYIQGGRTAKYGVGRWNDNRRDENGFGRAWVGTPMYPVSVNCNCPDNYNFIDNKCVNRNSPFDSIKPFCY
jgi:hypothetical protein